MPPCVGIASRLRQWRFEFHISKEQITAAKCPYLAANYDKPCRLQDDEKLVSSGKSTLNNASTNRVIIALPQCGRPRQWPASR